MSTPFLKNWKKWKRNAALGAPATQQDLFNYTSPLMGIAIVIVLSTFSNIIKSQKIARRTEETKRYYSWTGRPPSSRALPPRKTT